MLQSTQCPISNWRIKSLNAAMQMISWDGSKSRNGLFVSKAKAFNLWQRWFRECRLLGSVECSVPRSLLPTVNCPFKPKTLIYTKSFRWIETAVCFRVVCNSEQENVKPFFAQSNKYFLWALYSIDKKRGTTVSTRFKGKKRKIPIISF